MARQPQRISFITNQVDHAMSCVCLSDVDVELTLLLRNLQEKRIDEKTISLLAEDKTKHLMRGKIALCNNLMLFL